MSIIKASIVEVEVQEQAAPDAGAKYMVVVRYEPDGKEESDILKIILTNQKPIIKETTDLGDRVVESVKAPTSPLYGESLKPKPMVHLTGFLGSVILSKAPSIAFWKSV